MIIYYFNFYFLLFLIYKDIILIFLFSIRLVNKFKSDKLLNPIIDPPIKILHPPLLDPVTEDKSMESYKRAGI
jgi:hypothetical protein